MEDERHRTRYHDHQAHPEADGHGLHRGLDLDAEVFRDQLAAVLDLTGLSDVRAVVDLGAGTGAGSRMLRTRFPNAEVTCIDNDPRMVKLLRKQGFNVLEADLDRGFPALAGSSGRKDVPADGLTDLVWASSSLHHIADPARLLAGVRRALAPGGVVVVVELATLPRFLSDPSLGDPGAALLEQRCHATAAVEGWNHYPDWTPVVEAAGFVVARSEVTTVAPATPAAREYAREWFMRFSQLAALTPDDREAVNTLLERLSDDLDLKPSATRTVWVATSDQIQSVP